MEKGFAVLFNHLEKFKKENRKTTESKIRVTSLNTCTCFFARLMDKPEVFKVNELFFFSFLLKISWYTFVVTLLIQQGPISRSENRTH